MAEAGFYYTGHDDLARCFFCKGGLKTWSPELRPWVQHAQWFPKCPFVLQAQGSEYVQAVQALKDKVDVVSIIHLHYKQQNFSLQSKDSCTPLITVKFHPKLFKRKLLRRNPKKTQVDDDFSRGKGTSQVTPDKTSAGASNAENVNTREDFTESRLNSQELSSRAGELERLEAENQELTSSRFCKICLSEEATILFLPCGHLVACAQCAPALRTCAICRQRVSGTVRIETD
ncbi:inhibitor of apoptosis protein-like [Pomacea canaliculata]|uniref:inhibitor of apoptosis protein-like n=1 Tax=Pomacea canaliculata TaxID=400727 RepID=UPI000D733086|nr:inhibitor of apoptosis protein-like [Pomacea canaliculata]